MNDEQNGSRRQFSEQQKVAILKEHLFQKMPISEVCTRHGLNPTVFYRWQKDLFENAPAAFEARGPHAEGRTRKLQDRVEKLTAKLARKDEVIAELMEDHERPKKKRYRPKGCGLQRTLRKAKITLPSRRKRFFQYASHSNGSVTRLRISRAIFAALSGSQPNAIRFSRRSTPTGWWRVALDGKQVKATWYPPPNRPVHKTEVPYTDPDYAFGPKGLWIGLEGIEPNTAGQDHYGIHSTNDESSVGKASSLGCIRLKDKDIDLAFSLLYPVHSYVQVRD